MLDENFAAERNSVSDTRKARIRHGLEQNDDLDLTAAVDALLYGSGNHRVM